MGKIKRYVSILLICVIIFSSLCTSASANERSELEHYGDLIVDYNDLHIGSYFKYLFFIGTTELPKHFVYFDAIDDIGEFYGFTDFAHGSYYRYWAVDENSYEIRIDVMYVLDYESENVVVSEKYPSDMRQMDEMPDAADTRYTVVVNGVEYVYGSKTGKLSLIRYYNDNILYQITVSNYPLEEDDTTFVGRLLSDPENAHELFEDFSASGGGVYRWQFWIYSASAAAILVASVTTVTVLAVKRRRKKPATDSAEV